jgi:DNA topoisomerase-1
MEETPPDEVTLDAALALLEQAGKAEEPLGICPDTHKPVYLKVGRFGPYVQRGTPEDEEKPQNASLMKGMTPEDVDLATALKLLTLPRNLGDHPQQGQPVMAYNGRFGPYVKCGEETRSLPVNLSPLDVTLEQAVELLAQPKTRGRGAAKKEPLKVFDASPVTGTKVQLLDGRYGPYLNDGETNASLPKGSSVEELTFAEALDLLAARAALGPPKKKTRARSSAPKSAAPKKAASKRRPAKAATAKSRKKKA